MALFFSNFHTTDITPYTALSLGSSSIFSSAPIFNFFPSLSLKKFSSNSSVSIHSFSTSHSHRQDEDNGSNSKEPEAVSKKRLSKQSLWEAKDSDGNDYLYRLGKEADNMNIAVGARAGVIDDLFAGNFLGRDSDIVFDHRQKVKRSFEYLQGDYYIAPVFMYATL